MPRLVEKRIVSKICLCFVEDATCTDDLQNGKETDVDCGGSDCYKCQDNKKCHVNDVKSIEIVIVFFVQTALVKVNKTFM